VAKTSVPDEALLRRSCAEALLPWLLSYSDMNRKSGARQPPHISAHRSRRRVRHRACDNEGQKQSAYISDIDFE
jgi:hypothetical protein